jgi:hypothetical protein
VEENFHFEGSADRNIHDFCIVASRRKDSLVMKEQHEQLVKSSRIRIRIAIPALDRGDKMH